ncbi:MAG TPA: phosphatidate cytidylyltransferase [Thermotogota bacterium]|jgi:phosphatidate cytidylyltransferase|nr:phosphatidate cytidylyltransferase [Thermotogota bacterium]NLH19107.1 phosphatidate cytidylyltransferase [Thermotogaceae bacterium]OQC31240.1 MAG: Phosphatidate cytidylyltransferase [Thermotogota bacterium ADurb.Bin062]HNW46302.1 phosphatidate cytidylyltransferase [Thermotogota bacterium]HNY81487.1 phosphatidate cytidylyltransferase [Thermotogota bacterium]
MNNPPKDLKKDRFSIKARWTSAIIGGLAISWMFFNIHTFLALAVLSTAIGGYEFVRLILAKTPNAVERLWLSVLLPTLTCLSGLFILLLPEQGMGAIVSLYALQIPLICVVELLIHREVATIKDRIVDAVFGVFYLPFVHTLGFYIYWKYGWPYALLAVTSTWIFDSMAFFVGIRYGKHPLMPTISPKKTVEGSIGGLVGGFFGLWLVIRLLELFWKQPIFTLWQIGLLSIGLWMSATFGDLFESALKRSYALKDIGKILPGHGGWLDRIDSMVFFIPTFALLLVFFK